ncbi:unnamed protein product, partial [Staurois parvus]
MQITKKIKIPYDNRCSTVSGGHSEHQIVVLRIPRECAQSKIAGTIYEWQPAPGLPPSGRLYTAAGRQ